MSAVAEPVSPVLGVYHGEAYLRAAALADPDATLHVWRTEGATIPLLLRPLPPECGSGFDAISPYDFSGPLWHPPFRGHFADRPYPEASRNIADTSGVARVWSRWSAWARRNELVTAFFRYHPLDGQATAWEGLPGLDIVQAADNVVIELVDRSAMLASFKPQVGRDLKVSRRAGVDCRLELLDAEGLEAFCGLYADSMKRLGAADYYRFSPDFFAALRNNCPESFAMASAWSAGERVAAALILLDGERAYYYLAASNDLGRRACAMNQLVVDTAGRLCERGVKRFHLGGGSASLRAFKQRFGPARVPYYVGRAVVDADRYRQLSAGCTGEFFPAYRSTF